MKDKIFLIVNLWVKTKHPKINDAVKELETASQLTIANTPNVEVLQCEILKTQSKHDKKQQKNGTRYSL